MPQQRITSLLEQEEQFWDAMRDKDGERARSMTDEGCIVVGAQGVSSIDANDASVWVRRKGRWVCALHTESLAGDPFGRDRRLSEH